MGEVSKEGILVANKQQRKSEVSGKLLLACIEPNYLPKNGSSS